MKSKRIFHFVSLIIIACTVPLISGLIKAPAKKLATKDLNDSSAENWATDKLSKMTLDEKIGQFFMISANSNQGEKQLKEVEDLVTKEKVGGRPPEI